MLYDVVIGTFCWFVEMSFVWEKLMLMWNEYSVISLSIVYISGLDTVGSRFGVCVLFFTVWLLVAGLLWLCNKINWFHFPFGPKNFLLNQ